MAMPVKSVIKQEKGMQAVINVDLGESRKSPEISRELELLYKSVMVLTERIKVLTDALVPVCIPLPVKELEGEKMPVTPLGGTIANNRAMIEAATNSINALIEGQQVS